MAKNNQKTMRYSAGCKENNYPFNISMLWERIPSGLVVMTLAFRMELRGFESAAWRMLLSQTGFETMNPALPAKAVGPQPVNVPLRIEL